jgi:hypothetical protein
VSPDLYGLQVDVHSGPCKPKKKGLALRQVPSLSAVGGSKPPSEFSGAIAETRCASWEAEIAL